MKFMNTEKGKTALIITAAVLIAAIALAALLFTRNKYKNSGGETSETVVGNESMTSNEESGETGEATEPDIAPDTVEPSDTDTDIPKDTDDAQDTESETSDVISSAPDTTTELDYKDIIDDYTSSTETEKEKEEDKAKPMDKPVTEAPPKEDTGGVSFGPNIPEVPEYSCGAENHHCSNEFTHATVVNLELEGCPTCGSHSCPSFYALDEWGNTLYTPSKCSDYDKKTDPVHYCQTCGKPAGNGRNGTCVFYVADTSCSECGEEVKAWTCHTCK